MRARHIRHGLSWAALGLAAAVSTPALAQSRQVATPNVSTADGDVSATLNGQTFVNHGIVGAGRLDATTIDFRGETLGSFSGMAVDLKTWHRNADGSYAGGIYTLPDRGPMDGAIDYRNRVHTSDVTFTPLTGAGALPQSPSSQRQLVITPTGGFTLKDANGVEMTGRDPGASTVTRGGIVYPLATDGSAANHVSLDSEAIAFLPDGSFYISDEYAAGLYYFDPSGKQIGAIQTVNALLPRTGGTINFNSVNPGQTGRRNNQGLEAMAVTPDNKKLVTILQSATVQDTNGSQQQTRNNTRILIYDISSNPTPTTPIGHYVLQLPVFNNDGSGGAANRTAAQSEMLALNDTQFLVLARDGIGRGIAADGSASPTPVFKSILLVDTAGATNLAGSQYETGNTPIATNGTLNPAIVPVQQVELVNMLNSTQLAKVGMNLNRLPTTNPTSIGEKWEAMALAPVLEEGAPQDFFLFVGNDNDFQGTDTVFNGTSYESGALDGTGNNDSILLVYRLTLPTYVDPQALAALNQTSPEVLYGTRIALNDMAVGTVRPAVRQLNAQRSLGMGSVPRVNVWLEGDSTLSGAGASPLSSAEVDHIGATGGVDIALDSSARLGVFASYRNLDGHLAPAAPFKANAWAIGGYASAELPMGFYVEGSGAWFGDIDVDRVARFSAYGQMAIGQTSGDGWGLSSEAGWQLPLGAVKLTPFVGVDYTHVEIEGYTESGASVSNLVFPARTLRKLTASAGGEISTQIGALRPALRAGYSIEDERDSDSSATVRLNGAEHAMGSVTFPLADTERDSAFAELRLAARRGAASLSLSALGRWGRGEDDRRVTASISYGF